MTCLSILTLLRNGLANLRTEFREEERQRQAAVEYAEAVKKQNEELKARIDKLDTTYVGEFDTRVQSQSIAAKEAYRKALEDGNADAMYEAQQNISRIAMEEARLAQLKADREDQSTSKLNNLKHNNLKHNNLKQSQILKQKIGLRKNTWFGARSRP